MITSDNYKHFYVNIIKTAVEYGARWADVCEILQKSRSWAIGVHQLVRLPSGSHSRFLKRMVSSLGDLPVFLLGR